MRHGLRLLVLIGLALGSAPTAAGEVMALSHAPNDPLTTKVYRVLAEAYRRIGIETRDVQQPNERSLRAVNAGEADGEVMRMGGIEIDYPNLARVPEPVFEIDTMAYTTGQTFAVDGWESLRPYTLCVLRGIRMVEIKTEGMTRTFANSLNQLAEMIEHDRCQVGVFGRVSAAELAALSQGRVRPLEPPINRLPLYHYVHRRHQLLVPQLATALHQMREDGTMAALLASDSAPATSSQK